MKSRAFIRHTGQEKIVVRFLNEKIRSVVRNFRGLFAGLFTIVVFNGKRVTDKVTGWFLPLEFQFQKVANLGDVKCLRVNSGWLSSYGNYFWRRAGLERIRCNLFELELISFVRL